MERSIFYGKKIKSKSTKKLEAVKKYLLHQGSYETIGQEYDVHFTVIREWIRQYEAIGDQGLMPKKKNNSYTRHFKEQVVMDYLSGNYSIHDLAKKYKIPSKSTVQEMKLLL
jgi:transposase-like protein